MKLQKFRILNSKSALRVFGLCSGFGSGNAKPYSGHLQIRLEMLFNCGLRGGTGGAKPGSGVQRFSGPLGPRNSTPRFSDSGSRKPLPRGPLKPWKGSQGLGGGSSGASERCVRFNGEAPFSRMPLERVPTLGFLPSGHR